MATLIAPPPSQKSATIVGLTAIPLWSLTPVLVVILGPLSPFFLMGFRFLISGLILSFASIVRGDGFFDQFRIPTGAWILNIIGILVSQNIYIYALLHAPTAEANFINFLWPIYVVLLSAWVGNDKLHWPHIAGMIMGFMGCGIIMFGDGGARWNPDYAIGYGLAILAGLTWAIYQVGMHKFYAKGKNTVQGAPFLIYALICFFIYHQMDGAKIVLSVNQWPILIAFGIIPVAYLLWEHGIKRGYFHFLTVMSYFIPMLAALWVLLWNGGWSASLIVGGGMIVLAPIMANYRGNAV